MKSFKIHLAIIASVLAISGCKSPEPEKNMDIAVKCFSNDSVVLLDSGTAIYEVNGYAYYDDAKFDKESKSKVITYNHFIFTGYAGYDSNLTDYYLSGRYGDREFKIPWAEYKRVNGITDNFKLEIEKQNINDAICTIKN